jgi:hypothetical protein
MKQRGEPTHIPWKWNGGFAVRNIIAHAETIFILRM